MTLIVEEGEDTCTTSGAVIPITKGTSLYIPIRFENDDGTVPDMTGYAVVATFVISGGSDQTLVWDWVDAVNATATVFYTTAQSNALNEDGMNRLKLVITFPDAQVNIVYFTLDVSV